MRFVNVAPTGVSRPTGALSFIPQPKYKSLFRFAKYGTFSPSGPLSKLEAMNLKKPMPVGQRLLYL